MTAHHATWQAPAGHILAHPRTVFQIRDTVDVSTTSAFDFDVDASSGFMPPLPPLKRLPVEYDAWESALENATRLRLKPAEAVGLSEDDERTSALWRAELRQMPVLGTQALVHSEILLRRAHHVLTFLLSFYSHSHPRPAQSGSGSEAAPLVIPASIAVPLSTVSRQIGIAPVVTYADTVLWNWIPVDSTDFDSDTPSESRHHPLAPNLNVLAIALPSPKHPQVDPELECLTLFTGLASERHFYITSAKIELASATALSLMQRTLDELFLSDTIAVRRIATHLQGLADSIDGMTAVLATMRDGCDPAEFYRDIRPWFRGGEAWPGGMGFEFEGVTDETERERARFTNGASAGQSSIVHALDIFLGTPNTHSPYLHKMEYHMPRHHRYFLRHLRSLPPTSTLSHLVTNSPLATEDVKLAFNKSVLALKRFRDTHIRIAALYIVTQRAAGAGGKGPAIGTGGTELVPFLKNLRDNTARTVVPLAAGTGSPSC